MNLWYSEEILKRLEAFANFVELTWIFEEQRQSLKLLKPRSFDTHKNATVLMIVMLDHSKVDMKSNDCRKMSGNNRDANRMLIIIWEGAKFSYKDRCKFIDLFT